jgi:serine/threonine-protein kinase
VRTPGVDVPRALEAVVMKLLKKDVRARYAAADAVIAALDTALPAAVAEPMEVSHDALPLQIAGAVPPSLPVPPLLGEGPAGAGAQIHPPPLSPSSHPPRIEPSILASRSELSHQGTGPPRKSARMFEWGAVLLAVLLLGALVLAALKQP